MGVNDLYKKATKVYLHDVYSIPEFNKSYLLKKDGKIIYNIDKYELLNTEVTSYQLNESTGDIVLILERNNKFFL